MAGDLESVLRRLEEAAEFARTYRFEMTDDYRQLIARVEAMPRNQSGADRSGRWIGSRADADVPFSRHARATAVTHPLAPLARELAARSIRYLLIGVSGANLYGPSGQAVFVTEDFDLFLPPDPDHLVRAWASCEQAGLDLWPWALW